MLRPFLYIMVYNVTVRVPTLAELTYSYPVTRPPISYLHHSGCRQNASVTKFTNLPPWYDCVLNITSLLFKSTGIYSSRSHTDITDSRSFIFSHTKESPLSRMCTNYTNMQIIHEYNVKVLADKVALLLRQLLIKLKIFNSVKFPTVQNLKLY